MPRKAKPAIRPIVESHPVPAELLIKAPPPVRARRKAATTTKKRALPAKPLKTTHQLEADLLEAVARAMPGADREFEKMRKAHAAGADLGTLLFRNDFARALTIWLKNMKYQIGVNNPKDFKAAKEVAWAKHLVALGAHLLGSGMPMFVSGGASSEETFPVVLPFLPLADVVAFQVKSGTPMLLPIIFADGLKPEVLRQRFQQFMELGKPLPQFGLRLNGDPTSPAYLYPLLVFFNEACYQTAVSELMPGAHLRNLWDHLDLFVGFVNVPGKQVAWPELHGLLADFGSWLKKTFGQKAYPFETADLLNVLQLIESL